MPARKQKRSKRKDQLPPIRKPRGLRVERVHKDRKRELQRAICRRKILRDDTAE
jgi:hypothetical protein